MLSHCICHWESNRTLCIVMEMSILDNLCNVIYVFMQYIYICEYMHVWVINTRGYRFHSRRLCLRLLLFWCVWLVSVCVSGLVSCACCADNQWMAVAGSVQQEQGSGLLSVAFCSTLQVRYENINDISFIMTQWCNIHILPRYNSS